jgi:hypothetical protein
MTSTQKELEIVKSWNENLDTPEVVYLKKMGCRGNAEHFGKRQFSPSGEWAQYNTQKSYSKTDIKIGNHKISLKSMNDHLVMSSKKNEAIATFMCVANELYDGKIPSLVTEITNDLEEMITKGLSPITITKAKKAGDNVIIDAQQKHADILDSVIRIFDDPVFITAFLQEVLSGRLKFGENSDGCATHLLVTRDNEPELVEIDDPAFLSRLASHVDIRIDFKSSGKTQGKDRGTYRYWSVLQMISKELIKDSVLYEDSIFKKSLSFVLSLFSKIKNYISTWGELFDFLEVEPEIKITYKG